MGSSPTIPFYQFGEVNDMKCKKCKKEISDRDKYRTSWEKDGETWHECGKCSGTMSTEDALALALDALAKIDSKRS